VIYKDLGAVKKRDYNNVTIFINQLRQFLLQMGKYLTTLLAASYLFTMQPSRNEVLASNTVPTIEVFSKNGKDCQPLDIMFLVDATASMISEIPDIEKNIFAVTSSLSRNYAETRYALSFVGDFPSRGGMYDLPYFRQVDFTIDVSEIWQGMKKVPNIFGGYPEEAYAYALRKSAKEKWRKDAAKIVVLFADNKDHDDNDLEASLQEAPYQLIALTTEQFANYWDKFADHQRNLQQPKLAELLEAIAEQHCQNNDFCQR